MALLPILEVEEGEAWWVEEEVEGDLWVGWFHWRGERWWGRCNEEWRRREERNEEYWSWIRRRGITFIAHAVEEAVLDAMEEEEQWRRQLWRRQMREEGFGIMEVEEWVVSERWAEARRQARRNLGIFEVGHGGLPGDGREGGCDVEEEARGLVREAEAEVEVEEEADEEEEEERSQTMPRILPDSYLELPPNLSNDHRQS